MPIVAFGALTGSPAAAQVIQRVSVSSSGTQADNYSQRASISADGRYVTFDSQAKNLVPWDTDGDFDVFVHDRVAGTTVAASVDSNEVLGNGDSSYSSLSADGRYVVFESSSTNLVPGGLTGYHIFLRDLQNGTTELVSVNSGEDRANSWCAEPVVSGDGRYVAFGSPATNLVPGDTNSAADIFIRDRQLGTTELVSVSTGGAQGNHFSYRSRITPDGRYVAFQSFASLVPADTNSGPDVFLRDRLLGTTERVSLDSNGNQLGPILQEFLSISADGRFVSFCHTSSTVVPGDTNSRADVFLRDRTAGTTERMSVSSSEGQANEHSFGGSISADGRFVTFHSYGTDLVVGDTNGALDVFVRDRVLGTTERVSLRADGGQAQGLGAIASEFEMISGDGHWVTFQSYAANLVPGDTNGDPDILLRDLEAASFASLCDPGFAGIAACPCSNPPGGPTRGCDNSSATGGAALAASGTTDLSADTLVFTTSGEKPTALSIVLQGTGHVNGGTVYGQGIRCVGGSLKRLYAKSAVAGSITAPDFGAGEPSVSARSAAKGDVIQPGQPRWYMVYYRDNTPLGGCSVTSNFNATQTGQVNWSL